MSLNTQEALEYHWALDSGAAEVWANQIQDDGLESRLVDVYEALDPVAVTQRDRHRNERAAIYRGQLALIVFDQGPCSMGNKKGIKVDYSPQFDLIEELSETYPSVRFGWRGPGAKPRTGPEWPGILYSLDPDVRKQVTDTYNEAFSRGISIETEITQEVQFGALGLWLTEAWAGARDMQSTALRGAFSAYHLPARVKNSQSGQPSVVRDAIKTIRSNSADKDNTGVRLSGLAATHEYGGISSGVLPVIEGNKSVAILARGHELPEGMTSEERRDAAYKHLGTMCSLGVELDCAVMIDGSHDVPKMFSLAFTAEGKKDPDRLVPTLREILKGIEEDQIKDATQLVGALAEVGPDEGDTDVNWILDEEHTAELKEVVSEFVIKLAA